MSVPDSLQEKLDLFKHTGRLYREGDELFSEVSWLAVLFGQNVVPDGYHPLVDTLDETALLNYMNSIQDVIKRSVESMPNHVDYINQHCKETSL